FLSIDENKSYHVECFKCDICEEDIGDGSFFEIDSQEQVIEEESGFEKVVVVKKNTLYCQKCFERNRHECYICQESLEGESLKIGDNFIHKDCFICALCEKPLERYFEVDEELICV
ncbi:MAG: Four and a half LIM domains protein 5, partial [Paramarteilia canceri]